MVASRLVDVREYPEFAEGNIRSSHLVPLGTLAKVSETWDRSEAFTLVCQTGRRAEQARQILAANGFQSLDVLQGGIEAWKAEGRSLTVAAHRPWSMERQVRVTAGSLVIISVCSGFLGSRKLFLGAGLVGLGLIFAGVTDTCMMASLLSRMPWNGPDPSQCGTDRDGTLLP